MKLKVCGLRDNVTEVMQVDPDFAGFIFYPKSPRYVGDDFVMPEGIKNKVGVFVNERIEKVLEIQKKYRLDYIQLHGNEDAPYCAELKALGMKVIKVFAGNHLPKQAALDEYVPYTDFFLFDTKGDKPGGNGVAFDWSNLSGLTLRTPFFLSGGIGTDNVNLLSQLPVTPYALDVNSRFERSPALKDVTLLKQFKALIS